MRIPILQDKGLPNTHVRTMCAVPAAGSRHLFKQWPVLGWAKQESLPSISASSMPLPCKSNENKQVLKLHCNYLNTFHSMEQQGSANEAYFSKSRWTNIKDCDQLKGVLLQRPFRSQSDLRSSPQPPPPFLLPGLPRFFIFRFRHWVIFTDDISFPFPFWS